MTKKLMLLGVMLSIFLLPSALGATCDDFRYSKELTITNNNGTTAMPSGQVVFDTIDTTGDSFQDDGDDVRVFYQDTTEIDRVNLTEFNDSSSRVYFALQANISASSSDSDYSLCYGNDTATSPLDSNSIFPFADTFSTGINDTKWDNGSNWVWNSTGFVLGDYAFGSQNEFEINSSYNIGNLTVMMYRFNYPTGGSGTLGVRASIFSDANNCSESRYSANSDFMAITLTGYPSKIHPITIDDETWYWAMGKVGEGAIDNLLYLDWNLEITNTTAECNAMTANGRGWSVGEAVDHEIRIDDVYIYDYFYPEPTLALGAEVDRDAIVPSVPVLQQLPILGLIPLLIGIALIAGVTLPLISGRKEIDLTLMITGAVMIMVGIAFIGVLYVV